MLDINLFRENPNIIKADLKKRDLNDKIKEIDEIIKKDQKWRKYKQENDQLRKRRNEITLEITKLKKAGKNAKKELEEAKGIPKKLDELDKKANKLRLELNNQLMSFPNILHESVPKGKDDSDNILIKEINKKPKFSFKLKSHVDLIEDLNLVDLERAAKISGARWYFLLGDLAMLDFAIQKYALDFMTKKGYQLVLPPFAMNRTAYEGVTDLNDFEDVMYKIEDEDLYMIATSEHPLTARFMNEVLDEKELPIKNAGVSACFRKEAGSHGKDTKGIFRVHQFNKIEQIVFSNQEDSYNYHEEMLNNAADFFKSLDLHCRIVNVCTGDLGTVAAKKYDIEVWMPVQNKYREVVSCSNCTDYQARRLNIRYKTNNGHKFIHTLNSTCIATTRAIVAIIENFQTKNGTIKIPKVLQPYMGKEEIK